MNGHPTNDVEIFLRRLSLLNYYSGKVEEFKQELKELDEAISNIPSSSSWGISVPYGKKEIIDGKEVVIESKNITMPVTRNGYHKPNQDILWRMEELETMIIQYNSEINYINDTMDTCTDVVNESVRRYYLEGETWQNIADSIPISRAALERKIEREIKYALKGAFAPK